ncbi:MAG: D-tyrosyl-tRNA(Tyr) deacylase [Deltaproteobacteria bacterium]|nr:D-tyrosyl-tRNA(Tyr) deacylase [Deltaproteobacteria bacterium]
MRAVLQRVKESSVTVDNRCVGRIERGLLVLLGFARDDTEEGIDWLIDKIINLRVFEKEDGKFDESLLDIGGGLLIVSQFTLYGDCAKGRRPSFSDAMPSSEAGKMFELFIDRAKKRVKNVQTGVFQAHMDVALVNDGPVTIIIDSRK